MLLSKTTNLLLATTSLLAVGLPPSLMAADLLHVLPVTDRILMLQFSEGHIEYNGVREDGTFAPQGENRVHYSPFDRAAGSLPGSYLITSEDDPAYAEPRSPSAVGFKAKGHDFNNPWGEPPFLREYRVYVELPAPLQPGKTYRIHVGALAGNTNSRELTFDVKTLRSPTIHTSHVGYRPEAPKYAYFSQWLGTFDTADHPGGALDLARYRDGTFHLAEAGTGRIVRTFHGIELQKPRAEPDLAQPNMTGADVYALDFSDVTTPGRYIIVAEGMGRSWPFEIGEEVYVDAHRATLRSVFFQRRGIYKQLPEFDRVYPRSHHPDMNDFVYGRVEGEGAAIHDPRPVDNIWGWYADAGDWDGYHTHTIVPYILLMTWNLRPQHFQDGDYNNTWRERAGDPWTNEGQSGLPDILDEARWLIDFYRRARLELMRQGLGTGGVPGYVGRDAGAHYQPAWNDERVLYISEERVDMAYAYAGAAAWYAHSLDRHHGDSHPESASWLEDAVDAYNWAEESGERSEEIHRMRHLAAACLFLATGDADYQAAFAESWQADGQRNDGAWVGHNASMVSGAVFALFAAGHSGVNPELLAAVRQNLITRADNVTDNNESLGFRLGGIEGHQWQRMNLVTVPRVFFQIVAHELTGEEKYFRSIHNTLAYVFGGNPEGYSRLTGIGFEGEQDAFVCDAWYLLDFADPVYRNPIFPGYSAYGLYAGWDVGGPGSEVWARTSTLPPIDDWPVGEQRMRSRYSISGSEWTIHQNQPWYILATGYLLPEDGRPLPRYSRPTVKLRLAAGAISLAGDYVLTAEGCGRVERVAYYYDWRFIGESADRDNDFRLVWQPGESDLTAGAEVRLTAVAYDRRGQITVPTPSGRAIVSVVP
ncbi:MAG: hypothetical protein EA425_02065 [Puniceicoccaceae bacterium]|nr:MAG: hypothetical protein EA425_02065 [Puniceicoccaceae bacterium]